MCDTGSPEQDSVSDYAVTPAKEAFPPPVTAK